MSHFSALVSSWSTKRTGPDARAKVACARWVQLRYGNQAQLTLVALVNPVAQETRIAKPPSRQHKVDSQVDFGFPWDPRGFTDVQETVHEAIKWSWAAVARHSPWDLVMSMYSLKALPASSNGVGFDTQNKLIRTSSVER